MSNKTKIDISNSKRPPTSEINVFDEYEKERTFPITGELPLTIYVDKKEIVTLMTLGHYPELKTMNICLPISDVNIQLSSRQIGLACSRVSKNKPI